MSILHFEPLPKARPTAEHNAAHQSDTGIPGTYATNLSDAHAALWRAKRIAGDDPRIEIRKRLRNGVQILIVVRRRADDKITISMNGAAHFTSHEWKEFHWAIDDACDMIRSQR